MTTTLPAASARSWLICAAMSFICDVNAAYTGSLRRLFIVADVDEENGSDEAAPLARPADQDTYMGSFRRLFIVAVPMENGADDDNGRLPRPANGRNNEGGCTVAKVEAGGVTAATAKTDTGGPRLEPGSGADMVLPSFDKVGDAEFELVAMLR